MNVLITGITGRIGANLAVQLVQQGHQVRGLVWPRDPRIEKLQGLGLELINGNLANRADVDQVTDGIEVVYHLGAAFQGGGPFTEEEYFEINVRGTFNMLEAARVQQVSQFIFASSDALYDKYIPRNPNWVPRARPWNSAALVPMQREFNFSIFLMKVP